MVTIKLDNPPIQPFSWHRISHKSKLYQEVDDISFQSENAQERVNYIIRKDCIHNT